MSTIKKKTTVAVDPGVHALGVAVFQGKALFWAGLVQGSPLKGAAAASAAAWALLAELHAQGVRSWDVGVIEWPSQDDRRASGARSDLTDLIGVAGAVSAILGLHGELVAKLPLQWKGQVPKHIHHDRLFGAEVYRARLPAVRGWVPKCPGMGLDLSKVRWDRSRSENQDIADAIGLGLTQAS